MAELIDSLAKYAGRHCVAVVWEDVEPDQPTATGGIAFSAFIMSIRGLWFLVTAGHIVKDIKARQEHGRIFKYARIVDGWGIGATDKLKIPFPDIGQVQQGCIVDETIGYDYAWFHLRDYYRDLLRACVRSLFTPVPTDESSD
jgi:hypothetical protein